MNKLIFILGKNIVDITDADTLSHLQLGNYIQDIIQWLLKAIYMLIGGIADVLETCFEELSKIDFSNIVDLADFEKVLDTLTWSIIVIAIVIAAVIAIAKMDGSTEYIQYAVYAMVAILLFGTFNNYMNDYKNVGVEVIQDTFTERDGVNITLSQQVFYDNTYDMLISSQNNHLTKVNQNIPVWDLDVNEKLSKKDVQGKRIYLPDGTMEITDLSDGVMNTGLFEERYYRYDVDIVACIFVLLACIMVLLIGMIKLAYIGFDWFYTKLYHGVIMSSSVTSMNKVKLVYMSVVQSFISVLVVVAGYQIFEKLMWAIMQNDYHWITKVVLLFVGGFVTMLGSTVINKGLGLDDGTNFLIRSLMLSRAMGRTGRGLKRFIGGRMNNAKALAGDLSDRIGSNLDNLDRGNIPRELTPASEFMKNVDFENMPSGFLGNKDFENKTLYGGEDMTPRYHDGDIKDFWNDELDDNIADKAARYEQGLDLQNDIENRPGAQSFPYSPDAPSLQNADNVGEPMNSLDTSLEKKPLPFKNIDYGKYKTYDQYKKDFAKGDTSILNPNYNESAPPYHSNNVRDKQFPDWWYEDQGDTEEDKKEMIETMKEWGYSGEKDLYKMSDEEFSKVYGKMFDEHFKNIW